MKWELLFNEKENILFVKTYGIFDLATKIELTKECLAIIEKKNCCQCLIDNSGIKSTRIKFMEIYSIPEDFTALGMPHNLRIAEVFSEKRIKDFDILETVSHNRGYSVSVFAGVESALRWLKE
jgi:hypothetical protein